MKVTPQLNLLNDIRQAIAHSTKMLDENKSERMLLIKKISNAKMTIKAGEYTISKMQTANVETFFVRMTLTQMKKELQELRQSLLVLETVRAVEIVKFRAMHNQLDRFGVALDPERKRQADIKRAKGEV